MRIRSKRNKHIQELLDKSVDQFKKQATKPQPKVTVQKVVVAVPDSPHK